MRLAPGQGFAGGAGDAGRGVKVGLAHFEVNHLLASSFELFGFLQHVHHQEWGYVLRTVRWHELLRFKWWRRRRRDELF